MPDRNFDGYVKRTASRPLPAGRLFNHTGIIVFLLVGNDCVSVGMATQSVRYPLLVVLFIGSDLPFMKRITSLPQLVLGIFRGQFRWFMVR